MQAFMAKFRLKPEKVQQDPVENNTCITDFSLKLSCGTPPNCGSQTTYTAKKEKIEKNTKSNSTSNLSCEGGCISDNDLSYQSRNDKKKHKRKDNMFSKLHSDSSRNYCCSPNCCSEISIQPKKKRKDKTKQKVKKEKSQRNTNVSKDNCSPSCSAPCSFEENNKKKKGSKQKLKRKVKEKSSGSSSKSITNDSSQSSLQLKKNKDAWKKKKGKNQQDSNDSCSCDSRSPSEKGMKLSKSPIKSIKHRKTASKKAIKSEISPSVSLRQSRPPTPPKINKFSVIPKQIDSDSSLRNTNCRSSVTQGSKSPSMLKKFLKKQSRPIPVRQDISLPNPASQKQKNEEWYTKEANNRRRLVISKDLSECKIISCASAETIESSIIICFPREINELNTKPKAVTQQNNLNKEIDATKNEKSKKESESTKTKTKKGSEPTKSSTCVSRLNSTVNAKRPKRKKLKGKKAKTNASMYTLKQNFKHNCCACCNLLADYLQESCRMVILANADDSRVSQIFSEICNVTGCLCNNCYILLKQLLRILVVSKN